MNSYAILIDKKKMKNTGDKILLSLAKKNNVSKYQIYGNLIFLECQKTITSLIIEEIKLSEALKCSSDKKDIYDTIKSLIKDKKMVNSFAIKVNRKGNHKYNSMGVAKDLAGAVFEKWRRISVNLNNPELEIFVQIINNVCIVYLKYI